MNRKYIVAATLALSLTIAGTKTQAAEASPDLGSHIQQVFAEIHVGNTVGSTDWFSTLTNKSVKEPATSRN